MAPPHDVVIRRTEKVVAEGEWRLRERSAKVVPERTQPHKWRDDALAQIAQAINAAEARLPVTAGGSRTEHRSGREPTSPACTLAGFQARFRSFGHSIS